MPYVLRCPVIENACIAPDHFRLVFESLEIANVSVAGQFCMLQVAEGLYPFLRRPMCFERIHGDRISILYKIEGEGTELLSRFSAGQTISVQGPLGVGWKIDVGADRHIIVSGGIGVAPFPMLADEIIRRLNTPPEVILAARSAHLIMCEDEFRALNCTVHVATDDGSKGERLFAADMLRKIKPTPKSSVYACGPMVMMKTTSEAAREAGADCQVSLEAQMACGDGACLGCVVESKTENEGERMVRVCRDGPVFDTALIDWERHNLAYDL